MTQRALTVIAAAVLGAAGFAVLGTYWTGGHIRRWSGRDDLGVVACTHCHLQRIDRLAWAKPRPRHRSPAAMATSPDGTRLYVACDDVNEVVEADVRTLKVMRKIALPGGPFGIAIDDTGERLFVACRDSDHVVSIRVRDWQQVDAVEVGDAPVAIAFARTAAGDRLVVANSMSDNVSVLECAPLRELARPQAGREPYAVAVSAEHGTAYIANRLATHERALDRPMSELTLIDPTRGRLLRRHVLDSAHLAEGIATLPGSGLSLMPFVKVRNLVPITQVANGWVMSSGLIIADRETVLAQLPLDEANGFFADPSGIVIDPVKRRAYVASGGGDVVSVVDLARVLDWVAHADDARRQEAIDDLSFSAEYVLARIQTGRNPRHLALSGDGRKLFVAERLDDAVLVVDTETLQPSGRIVLGDGGRSDPIRRGERVFTSAAHTFQRQFSCRSCHPDGHVDGLAYDFDGDGIGDNFLDNRTLQGLAGTGPFKWNGRNATLEIQCGERFARVLMRTDPIPKAELKDLVAFVEAQPPPRWERKRNHELTPAEERGRRIFFAETKPDGTPIPRERRCHTCHRPPLYTYRLPSAVGTQGPRDSTNYFDTPHLLGIAHTAPYLHDGRAKTLEELWTVYQTNDLHGVTSHMNKHELNDLVEFLKTL